MSIPIAALFFSNVLALFYTIKRKLLDYLYQWRFTLMTAAATRQRLSARLAQPGLITAPGIFDMISARLADRMGFDLLYMTGYGTVASYLGLPDAGLATYTDMVNRASAFAQGSKT